MKTSLIPLTPVKLAGMHVRDLAQASGSCLSLYLAPWRAGTGEPSPKQVVFESVRGIVEGLRNHGVRGPDIEDLLRPVLDLANDPEFNQGHTQGWAIFRSPNQMHFLRGPAPWANRAGVAGRFDILPLLAALSSPQSFSLVALTHHGVRWFRGEGDTLKEMPLPPGVPAAPEVDRQIGAHAANRSSSGRGRVHFGVNETGLRTAKHFHDFCLAVARGLETEAPEPRLVAGTREALAEFREAAPTFASEFLTLSPDGGFSTVELLERARQALSEITPPAEKRVVDRLRDGGEREVHAVLEAAAGGRVGHLFVEAGASMRGNVDFLTRHVPMTGEYMSADDDLYNAAAIETLRHGGQVWCVPPERMPAATSVVAELRY